MWIYIYANTPVPPIPLFTGEPTFFCESTFFFVEPLCGGEDPQTKSGPTFQFISFVRPVRLIVTIVETAPLQAGRMHRKASGGRVVARGSRRVRLLVLHIHISNIWSTGGLGIVSIKRPMSLPFPRPPQPAGFWIAACFLSRDPRGIELLKHLNLFLFETLKNGKR